MDRNTSYEPSNYPTLNTMVERECLYKYLRNSSFYLEFGSGGSTFDAVKMMTGHNKTIYSIEAEEEWYHYMRSWKLVQDSIANGKLHLMYMNIGPTRGWSRPMNSYLKELFPSYYQILHTPIARHPDTVLIDGRFRVMCGLEAVKHCSSSVRILIHDYTIRPHYHVLAKYLDEIDRADTLIVFSIKSAFNTTELEKDLQEYRYDSR